VFRRVVALAAAGIAALSLACGVTTVPGASAAPTPRPGPADLRPDLVGDARQLVIVSSPSWRSTVASLTYWELRSTGWKKVAGPFAARVGRNGMKADHVEGDGTSPAGSFPLVSAFGLARSSPTKLAYRQVRRGDCWISDVNRADYNQWVTEQPCGRANEDLYAIARGGAYRNAIVTGYNLDPVVPGAGSAIFIHLHSRTPRGTTKPTSGCVSLASWQLNLLLRRLDPAAQPRIVIGPAGWLTGG
jgi:L,D-peptidoglycan transpeptidase YkuD (ErfK/YbiS/YcfS/YnhG family)